VAERRSHGSRARVTFRQVADTEGRLVLIPEAMARVLRQTGKKRVTLTIELEGDKPSRPWTRLADAAREHMDDIDGITYRAARQKILRACKAGRIVHTETPHPVYVEPDSFAAWRLAERKRNLDRLEDHH